MKSFFKIGFFLTLVLSFIVLDTYNPSLSLAASPKKKAAPSLEDKLEKAKAAFDVNKMSDMSDYDPANPVIPTGDTIKIALVAPFSGLSAGSGEGFFALVQWVAHDINKRGGLLVDGKKKLIQVIKADHMNKVDVAKKVCERAALIDKVDFFWGADITMITKVVYDVAKKYKIIAMNPSSLSDELQDATHFSPYTFFVSPSARQIGQAMAYYLGQIRKKENKFYLLNPDYSGGRAVIEAFKEGLKEYYPTAQIVGEDYYKLFLTDFAPYLTKVKASGAEVIFTGAFNPDSSNMLKQSRQMGMQLPFAALYFDSPDMFRAVGIEGSKGLMNIAYYSENEPFFKPKDVIKFYEQWRKAQEKWKSPPYNNAAYYHNITGMGYIMATYWMMSVIERAQSTDPEKIIPVWENDSYKYVNGKVVKMRACDHKMISNLAVYETVPPAQQKVSMNIPPYYWFNDCSFWGPLQVIPASKILPWMDDEKLDRCKGKNGWGE